MDRDTILSISRVVAHLALYPKIEEQVVPTIIDYMVENGISEDKAIVFITTINNHPELYGLMLSECFSVALQYYEKKFGIFKLYKDRKLIAIY